jgi:hypothetical protein
VVHERHIPCAKSQSQSQQRMIRLACLHHRKCGQRMRIMWHYVAFSIFFSHSFTIRSGKVFLLIQELFSLFFGKQCRRVFHVSTKYKLSHMARTARPWIRVDPLAPHLRASLPFRPVASPSFWPTLPQNISSGQHSPQFKRAGHSHPLQKGNQHNVPTRSRTRLNYPLRPS